jgi:formiminoglutamase
MLKRSKCCLIGIPDHHAVSSQVGRLGARGGPSAFRKLFYQMDGKQPVKTQITDYGDVDGCTNDVDHNHILASHLIKESHRKEGFSVIIGGSHDHGFSHIRGIKQAYAKPRLKPVRIGCTRDHK